MSEENEEEGWVLTVEQLPEPYGGNAVFAGCLCVIAIIAIFALIIAGWRLI